MAAGRQTWSPPDPLSSWSVDFEPRRLSDCLNGHRGNWRRLVNIVKQFMLTERKRRQVQIGLKLRY
jgi:hypothetical protein